jgi:glycosyltransferase involved in cell wall biosynthesis
MVGNGRGADEPLRVHALIDSLGAGGAELLLAEFAAGAPEVGIELSVAYLHDRNPNPVARARLRRFGVTPTLVPVTKLLKPTDLRRVRRHLAQLRPDVVHTHLGASDFVGGLSARTLGIPAVSTLHAMEWSSGTLRERVRAGLVARARRRFADRVIAVSEAARRRYLAEGWDLPERVTTIYNGISGLARPGAGAAVRERLGLAPGDLVVGMLSTVRPEKGHDVALAAVAALRTRFPALRLVVVGDGPALPRVRELAAPLGEAALLAGHQEDVMAILDAFDVLLHPSYSEAFPTALLEAMAASVPVVATRVGGIPEIVEDETTGVLIDSPPRAAAAAAALERLAADAERRRQMGRAGQQRFQREFTSEVWARRTRALYDELLAARPGRAQSRSQPK